MGPAWGKGAREGPASQEAGKISSQCSARAGTTWARTRKAGQVRREKDQREQSERFFLHKMGDHVGNEI
jgi:hypothetical protein